MQKSQMFLCVIFTASLLIPDFQQQLVKGAVLFRSPTENLSGFTDQGFFDGDELDGALILQGLEKRDVPNEEAQGQPWKNPMVRFGKRSLPLPPVVSNSVFSYPWATVEEFSKRSGSPPQPFVRFGRSSGSASIEYGADIMAGGNKRDLPQPFVRFGRSENRSKGSKSVGNKLMKSSNPASAGILLPIMLLSKPWPFSSMPGDERQFALFDM